MEDATGTGVVGGGRDRISSLPEDVLRRIISFLPLKDAVRAESVARGWRRLWTSAAELDFDYSCIRTRCSPARRGRAGSRAARTRSQTQVQRWREGTRDQMTARATYEHESRSSGIMPQAPYYRNRLTNYHAARGFVELIDQTLSLHDAPKIRRFRLNPRKCFVQARYGGDKRMQSSVDNWIQLALAKGVEELELEVEDVNGYIWPAFLFGPGGQSIKLLKLCGSVIDPTSFPRTVGFSSLQSLTLKSIWKAKIPIMNILCSCPLLEFLCIEDCHIPAGLIKALSLKTLKIKSFRGVVQGLELDTPKLHSLEYTGFVEHFSLSCAFFFPTMVVLDIRDCIVLQLQNACFENFLKGLQHAESLRVSCRAAELVWALLDQWHASLDNLKHLSFMRITREKLETHQMACLLACFPSLETVSLEDDESLPDNGWVHELAIQLLKSCSNKVVKLEVSLSYGNAENYTKFEYVAD